MSHQDNFFSLAMEKHLSYYDFLTERFALKLMYIITELANRLTDFTDNTPTIITQQRYQEMDESMYRRISDKTEIHFKRRLLENETDKISPRFRERIKHTPTEKLIHWVKTL